MEFEATDFPSIAHRKFKYNIIMLLGNFRVNLIIENNITYSLRP
jgi:hypothetical protein